MIILIGRAVTSELVNRGYRVSVVVRPTMDSGDGRGGPSSSSSQQQQQFHVSVRVIEADVKDPVSLRQAFLVDHDEGESADDDTSDNVGIQKTKERSFGPVDVVVSCVASRTGKPSEVWAVDYGG